MKSDRSLGCGAAAAPEARQREPLGLSFLRPEECLPGWLAKQIEIEQLRATTRR